MTKPRTSGRGSPPAEPTPRPLVETNPGLAIKLLEAQHTKITQLDPSDAAAVDDAQSFLLADVERAFGVGSPEWSQVWKDNIINEPQYVGRYDDGDDFGPYGRGTSRAAKVKAGIQKMLPRIQRLIERANELAALHVEEGRDSMGPFSRFPHHPFTLIKAGDERVPGTGIWNPGTVTVLNGTFPVAIGDLIERTLPNGVVERYEVLDPGFKPKFGGIPAHYEIKLRNVAHPPRQPQVVHNTTTYNNSGQVAAMGPGSTATDNTIIGQATQWNGIDRDRLVNELAKLRSALLAEAGDDDDAAAELGAVAEASKALKANDERGFKAALKRFGRKALALAQSLSLAYVDRVAREQLGLPPADNG